MGLESTQKSNIYILNFGIYHHADVCKQIEFEEKGSKQLTCNRQKTSELNTSPKSVTQLSDTVGYISRLLLYQPKCPKQVNNGGASREWICSAAGSTRKLIFIPQTL